MIYLKVLGIDDNDDINDLLKTIIESAGHDFLFVDNGKEGLQLIRENKFDLVFLDIAMPNFSGKDVIDALFKEDIVTKQKIIIFTASSISDSEIQALINKGAHSCIRKPITVRQMMDVLKN